MANVIDFRNMRPPTLPLIMNDEAGTAIDVTPPTVDLVEELKTNLPHLQELLTGEDPEIRTGLYDLAARLISCNRNLRRVTGEQLRMVYRLSEEDLVVFFSAYTDFISGIEHAKN